MSSLKNLCLAGCLAALMACSADQPAAGAFIPAADFKLEDYRGKVVLLNFWATWCPPCRVEIPDLVRLHETLDRDKVAVIGVSLDNRGTPQEVQDQLKRAVAHFGISYPIVLDAGFELNRQYGGFSGIPTTFLINQQGKILKTYSGPRSYEVFARDIAAVLASG